MAEDLALSRDHAHAATGTRAESRAPQVGDFIIRVDRWNAAEVAGPISRITAQRVYHPSFWENGREAFTYLDEVRFVGSQDAARALREKLVSSKALMDEERASAQRRHYERTEKLIAEALGREAASPSSPTVTDPGMASENGLNQ